MGDKMYSYIYGKITEIELNMVTLDNQGIGYQISVPNPFNYNIGENIKLYIYTHIREDEYSLFGFKSLDEKKMFLKLISVKGLGPKMAMPFLASSIDKIIYAINNEEYNYLKKFPKVGDKLAKQIILDLKGKIIGNLLIEQPKEMNEELFEVLSSLGYKTVDIKNVIKKVDFNLDLEEQLKESFKLLMK